MDNFSKQFAQIPIDEIAEQSLNATPIDVLNILGNGRARSLEEFAMLISPAAEAQLEQLAGLSQAATQKHFGRVMRLFAPLYLSNECVNICKYCGFSRNNPIPRITISADKVVEQTKKLAQQGMRNLLLVAGEHPKYVSNGYVEECIVRCLPIMPSVGLELGPLETQDYFPLVKAGAETLIVYQETYHEPTYRELHTAGPKKHYHWRMDTPERAYDAGFRRLGIGALFGLADWRYEAIAVAAHAQFLLRRCWKAQISISLPRMRPAAGGFQPQTDHLMPDRGLVQTICALRLFLPHVGITISTRESPKLRDGLITVGPTLMSAGASTEPGGYDYFDENNWTSEREQEGEQFHIADERSPKAFAQAIRERGYEPVWKDFDGSLVSAQSTQA